MRCVVVVAVVVNSEHQLQGLHVLSKTFAQIQASGMRPLALGG
jgi:hypothetical protein